MASKGKVTTTVTASTSSGRVTKAIISKLEANPHMEALSIDLGLLEKILLQAKEAYYNTDKPLFTDDSYDILEHILFERNPGSIVFKLTGAKIDESHDKVKLKYYLGSLDKVKPGEKVLTKWLKEHKGSILISEKLDGLSCLLIIEKNEETNGTKTKPYKMFLYKHGDGNEGQEISSLLENINLGNLNTKLIQKLLDGIGSENNRHIAIRGEIIMTKELFNKKYTTLYPKSRSLIAGIVNSKKPDSTIVKDMEIVFYEFIAPGHLTYEDQFKMLDSLGVNVARYTLYDTMDETQLPALLIDYKKKSKYEIDGIILSDNTKPHNRVTSGNPSYAVAFKMPLEAQMANTTILNIEYNISKHGALNPRIMYKPIVIGGDTHQYTSGFNLRYIVDNKLGPGSEIQIIKSGDVIPYIYTIIKSSSEPQMPPKEIKWHWNETEVDAIVDDKEENEDVRVKRIISFFDVMKIAGVGEGVVNKLVNAGYNEVKMILQLTPDVIAGIDGFQLKSATNIYNSIHKVINNDTPVKLERVMMASNVFGLGLGEKKFKLIVDAIPHFLEKWRGGEVSRDDIMSIDGFSDKSTDVLMNGMSKFLEWLDLHKMIKLDNCVNDRKSGSSSGSASSTVDNTKFVGMVVVFTGVRNTDMEEMITKGGGVIGSGVSGKTTLVVAKDSSENTGKIKTAREKGIQVMNIEEFGKFIGFK
jgi:DNA ligase (NAD+)